MRSLQLYSFVVCTVKRIQQSGNGETMTIHEYFGKHEAWVTGKTALAQISNTNRQQFTNNNSNSTNSSAQRLTADQQAKRTSLHRDSSNSADIQRRLSHLSNCRIFIPFLTGCDVTYIHLVNSV
ncbi:hypothetical protein AVEN_155188-1 [Araneus ventricosus]|uniref:Uncharacterized protein n=1 Tax=Araneus ventricosus TaxID=182803 RepID=A0A4Y2MNA0_ARAVE|nr:hypothetical protein AVEN_155188-1 [Araneus ventricosus]